MFRRLASALTGRDVRERLAAVERLVRKLGETQRDQAAAMQTQLGEVAAAVAQQPTAKDLRELRQAMRGVAAPGRSEQDRGLIEALERIASSTRPIVIGPWTGEVGFELL